MPKKNLKEEFVAKLRPPAAGQVDYYDTVMPGLVLRVNYGGRKAWRALYYVKRTDKNGKRISMPTTHALGLYPHLNSKEARDAARKFLADPQKALAQADAGNFKEVAENFIKRHVEASKLRTQPEIERCLTKYVYPVWEGRSFREIRRGDVADLLDKVQDEHGPRQADLVLAIVRKMMNWYASRNDDYVSPVVRGMHRSNGAKRKRILDDMEIRTVWNVCDDLGSFGALVKVLLLTGQRKDKVATMKRDEIVDCEWRIASEPREKTNAGTLRLPQMVLDIIAAQPQIVSNPYVFTGRGGGPFNSFSQRKDELDERLKGKLPTMKPWVIHDLRRTAKLLMARTGIRPDISERVLGHTIRGVEGVYDQHGYGPEKADALKKLAGTVELIINPPTDNVVPLREQRA